MIRDKELEPFGYRDGKSDDTYKNMFNWELADSNTPEDKVMVLDSSKYRLSEKNNHDTIKKKKVGLNSIMIDLERAVSKISNRNGNVEPILTGYAVITSAEAQAIKDYKNNELSNKLICQTGALGTGLYIIKDNKEHAIYSAKKENKHVIEVKFRVGKTISLIGSQECQGKIHAVLKHSKNKTSDECSLMDELLRSSKIRYDSVTSVYFDEPINNSRYLYDYMSEIVCLRNEMNIIEYKKFTHNNKL